VPKPNKLKTAVYELSEKGYVKVGEETSDQSTMGASANPYQTDGQINTDSAKMLFLRGNPFMYNSKTAAYQITSVEEYLIKIRKQEMAFGDVLRNPEFTRRKRRKLIKQAFQTWDKQYNTQKKTVFTENEKTVDVIGDVNFMKISLGMKLLIIFLFGLMIFIISTDSFLWEKIAEHNFGFRIYNQLIGIFEGASWLKIVGNLTTYLLILFIFYAAIYTMISTDYVKEYKMAQNYLKKSEKTISRQYKKKSQKARKYYLSYINSKKPFIAPLDIKAVEEGQVNIATFDRVRQVTVDRAYKLKKSRPIYVGIKNIFLFLSVGGAATVIGYALFKMIISVF